MRYKILVIEDNAAMRANIAGILELGDYDVLTAANGKLGVALAQQHQPDLILCDIMMPELDGYGVLHILSKDPKTAVIPFIFLTAKAEKSDVREGMGLGANDYITKPFDGSELLRVVELQLKRQELLKTTFANDVKNFDDFVDRTKQFTDFGKLYEHQRSKKIRKRDFLFMEGEEPNDVFYIQHGHIKTYRTTRDGKEFVTGLHRDGAFIGFLPLLEHTNYQETAVALEDSEVRMMPKDVFSNLIFTNREVSRQFIRLLANDLADAEKRLLEIAYQPVRQRVALTLLRLHDQAELRKGIKRISISRKDMSSIVGTATESLNRTLADFRDEKLITMTHDGIEILDRGKLEGSSR